MPSGRGAWKEWVRLRRGMVGLISKELLDEREIHEAVLVLEVSALHCDLLFHSLRYYKFQFESRHTLQIEI